MKPDRSNKRTRNKGPGFDKTSTQMHKGRPRRGAVKVKYGWLCYELKQKKGLSEGVYQLDTVIKDEVNVDRFIEGEGLDIE